jgi:hypothetical protein
MPGPIEKYGALWPEGTDPLQIELACIARHGKWTSKDGKECGQGELHHFMEARKLIWPERYCHRWTILLYEQFIANDLTVLMGAASTQKTSHAVEFCLLNYWARPNNTLVILSTVNMDKLDIGVYAELKMLWQSGRDRHDWLSGNLIEHKRAITTDNIEETSRDFRKGCIARPCYMGGRWVGLGVLAGTKQDYIFYVADEVQFMQEAFSASWPHLFSNGQVKIIASGNPKHDPEDELGKTSEPKEGWNSHPEPDKTEVWDTKFMGGKCVNLVGTDSPNFDVPEDAPVPYPRLIGYKFSNRIKHDFGDNSFQFYQLVKGVMRVAFAKSRVITRQLCREHRALEKAEWKDDNQKKIYALDPSYGGEDRCVGMPLKFGIGSDGNQLLEIGSYRIYKLNLTLDVAIEDQIANILKDELDTYGIDPSDAFYDACGKGTLGAAFARKFGIRIPIAVDSGQQPTKRPVMEGLMVEEKGQPRLKRCDEHYHKFVSEMWYSIRYMIEAEQLRGLTEDVMAEGCARIWDMAAGNKIYVEAKSDPKQKEDLKRRLGKSPDLFDTLVIGGEGARQRGFKIKRLGVETTHGRRSKNWLDQKVKQHESLLRSKQLVHS